MKVPVPVVIHLSWKQRGATSLDLSNVNEQFFFTNKIGPVLEIINHKVNEILCDLLNPKDVVKNNIYS